MLKYLIYAVVCFMISAGCKTNSSSGLSNNRGRIVSQQHLMDEFDHLELEGHFNVILQESETPSLSVSAEEGVLPLLLFDVENGTLTVKTMGEKPFDEMPLIELRVSTSTLKKIGCSGVVKLGATNRWVFDTLNIETAGVFKLNMELNGTLLVGHLAGASTLDLSGTLGALDLDLPGAANISAFDLETEKVTVDMAGAGRARFHVTKMLKVKMAGAGMVTYKGSPKQVYSNISGFGRVKQVD